MAYKVGLPAPESLTKQQRVEYAVRLLENLRDKNGHYPLNIYRFVKQQFRLTAVVVGILRIRDDTPSVWLQPRGKGDPDWPEDTWSSGGAMSVRLDTTFADTVRRVWVKEHNKAGYIFPPKMFGSWYQNTRSGPQHLVAYFTQLGTNVHIDGGRFFPLNLMPVNIMEQDLLFYLNLVRYLLANPIEDITEETHSRLVRAERRLYERVCQVGFEVYLTD